MDTLYDLLEYKDFEDDAILIVLQELLEGRK